MEFLKARRNMVDCQLLPNQITDSRIIEIMEDLPREKFLPKLKQSFAYADNFIACGEGRHLMEPLVTARMLQALELKNTDVALCIGCASGYSVAALSKVVNTVFVIEENKSLSNRASKVFSDNEMNNIVIVKSKFLGGFPEQAPYDVIFFDGGIKEIPKNIENQLAEAGRAVAVVFPTGATGTLRIYKKFHGIVSSLDLFSAKAPLLPGFSSKQEFVF